MPTKSDCPVDFDKQSRLVWRQTKKVLNDEAHWHNEYRPLLERYVRALEVGRLARGRITQRENELEGLRPQWIKERDELRIVEVPATITTERLKKVERDLSRTAYTAWGSQGQLVPHPDLKTAREAERDANDYAKELLLTPASRAKGGDSTAGKGKPGAFGAAFGN